VKKLFEFPLQALATLVVCAFICGLFAGCRSILAERDPRRRLG
jgi:hypothetical protein